MAAAYTVQDTKQTGRQTWASRRRGPVEIGMIILDKKLKEGDR